MRIFHARSWILSYCLSRVSAIRLNTVFSTVLLQSTVLKKKNEKKKTKQKTSEM